MAEKWKYINETNNEYIISNLGKIISLPKICKNRYGNRKLEGRIMKTNINNNGYECIHIKTIKGKKKFYVHRLVAEAFIPNLDNKPFINHKDCNPLNNCVSNLEWCTPQENVDYMIKLGRNKRTKEWLKNAHDGQRQYFKKVIGKNKENKIIILECINDGVNYGFSPSEIVACCKHYKGKKTHKGYKWEYLDEFI